MQQAKDAANNVAVKKEAGVPTQFNLEELAGQGQEFVTARDTKLPILKILYSNSPVLDESDGKYIESAKQGDIYNETSGNLFKGKAQKDTLNDGMSSRMALRRRCGGGTGAPLGGARRERSGE